MGGAQNEHFRAGNRAELLAQCFLNTLAFTTSVPRQEDVGLDFHCSLALRNGKMSWAGPAFTVQAKSSARRLRYAKRHEITWLVKLTAPFFFAIGKGLHIELYSTWRRVGAFLEHGAHPVSFRVGSPPDGSTWVRKSLKSGLTIYLGDPVISGSISDLLEPGTAATLAQILETWIEIDFDNIARSRAKLHLTAGPFSYRTNTRPTAHRILALAWNPKNRETCNWNLCKSAIAMRATLAGLDREGDEDSRTLDAFLRAWHLAPEDRELLRRSTGLEME